MPYVVTTGKRFNDTDSGIGGVQVESRRAVATIEDARNAADAILADHSDGAQLMAWAAISAEVPNLPEAGGKVGPLPDGTMVEVEPVALADIWQAIRPDPPNDSPLPSTDEIIAAYNATQES